MRLPIINQTWASAAKNIQYFSDVADSRYQTKKLPEVDGNSEVGHCKKTEGIIKYFHIKALIILRSSFVVIFMFILSPIIVFIFPPFFSKTEESSVKLSVKFCA